MAEPADRPAAVDGVAAPPSHRALDAALAALAGSKRRWAGLPVGERLGYLRELHRGFARVAAGQVAAALEAKGGAPGSPIEAEEWLAGPYVNLRTTRLLAESLEEVRDRGRIELADGSLRRLPDGRLAARVFPADLYDRLLFTGFTGEVWLPPGVTPENLPHRMASAYREAPDAGVALVLGAGNVASIGPLDVVTKLFAEGQVALLKLNPVNAYLEPFIEDAFAALIADDFVRVVAGGAEEGAYLCHHPEVDNIHITGSARTHDAIVWGTGEEAARRRAAGTPLLDKPITSELGNVSPMILVPGPWSDADLAFQAENLATQMVQNGGFNCNATKVLVTWEGWSQRAELVEALGKALARVPPRPAYYPGAEERWARFRAAYPGAESFGEGGPGRVPPTLAAGVEPGSDSELAFREESFCAFSAETPLAAPDPAAFLERAVDFCNERLYGTLNAGIVIHPASRRELGAERLEAAIDGLRYGSVALNHWPALSYALGSTTWGAYPGHELDDIQSGRGVVHNARLFDDPEKSVVEGPFRVFPKPVWFVGHRHGARAARKLVEFEADRKPWKLPGIVLPAVAG